MSDTFLIHTDGGARGNPGPAAFAYTIERPGETDIEVGGFLGVATNNVAEYTALVKALEHARALGGRRLRVNSDSELLVQQMNGKYKVKNPGLLTLYREAKRLTYEFDDVQIRHIYREQNSRADQLCNRAMDDRQEAPIIDQPAATPVRAPAPPVAKKGDERVRDEAIAILRSASQAWADDEEDAPTPEHVWDRLWTLVQRARIASQGRS